MKLTLMMKTRRKKKMRLRKLAWIARRSRTKILMEKMKRMTLHKQTSLKTNSIHLNFNRNNSK